MDETAAVDPNQFFEQVEVEVKPGTLAQLLRRIEDIYFTVYDKKNWGEYQPTANDAVKEAELKRDIKLYVTEELIHCKYVNRFDQFTDDFGALLDAAKDIEFRGELLSHLLQHLELIKERYLDPNTDDFEKAAIQLFLARFLGEATTTSLMLDNHEIRRRDRLLVDAALNFLAERFVSDALPNETLRFKVISVVFNNPGKDGKRLEFLRAWLSDASNGYRWTLFAKAIPFIGNINRLAKFVIDNRGAFASNSSLAHSIGRALEAKSSDIDNIMSEIENIGRALSVYQLPATMHDEWFKNSRPTFENIKTIERIEQLHPGIANFLFREYGIVDFARYPDEMLVRMYQEHNDITSAYGVIVYPRSDASGAFAYDKTALADFSAQLRGNCLIRILEIDGVNDGVRKLARLRSKHGKIAFAVVGGHGTPESISFGDDDFHGYKARVDYATESSELLIETLSDYQRSRRRSRALGRYIFQPHAPIVLLSCSTGRRNGIGQAISRTGGFKLWAPDKTTTEVTIKAIFDQNGRMINIVPTFYGAKSNLYVAGEDETK